MTQDTTERLDRDEARRILEGIARANGSPPTARVSARRELLKLVHAARRFVP
jgi:hypothetical protein